LGFVLEENLSALFAITDVMVFPHRVGLSVSGPMMLAAAYGVPVVVSSVPTLADVLACPEATFQAGDPIGLTAAVLRVLGDADVRAKIQRRLIQLRTANAWPHVATQFARLYMRVLDGLPAGGLGLMDVSAPHLIGTRTRP
jgi:glycosyltransferase involved in cell wall biosynthesis